MGLLIFAWGIYIELQNCMNQTAHGPCLSQSLFIWTLSPGELIKKTNKKTIKQRENMVHILNRK